MTHICVSKVTIIVSDNGLSPGRRQAIIWNNAGILLIGLLGTNFCEILIEIHTFSFMKIHLKMSGKWRPFCLGLNVLTRSFPKMFPWCTYLKEIRYRREYVSKYRLMWIFIHWLYLLGFALPANGKLLSRKTEDNFVYHFVAICEFKLELQSGNVQFRLNSLILRAVWPRNLRDEHENDRSTLLWNYKLCALFCSRLWIQTGFTVPKRSNWVKIVDFSARVTLQFHGWSLVGQLSIPL